MWFEVTCKIRKLVKFVCLLISFQNDRYTVGGKEIFDSLTDLVEHFKRTGIEELSGTMVFLKQVKSIIFSLTSPNMGVIVLMGNDHIS